MIKKSKCLLISLCVLAIAFTSLGVWSLMPAKAQTTMTVQEALEEFEMEGGASVRVSTDKQGIRFCALLSDGAYTALEGANAEFGMLIVPKDYVTVGYELTVENLFGENAVYVPNVKASQVPKDKKAIIQVDNPFIDQENSVYKIYGSIVGVLDSNISRGFIGRAYVKVNGEYHLADYANGLVENNTRSMASVAKSAIEDVTSGVDGATLQTNYIDKVKEKSYSYKVNKVTIEIDGSVTTEELESGTAKFGTEINHVAESRFGFESYGVDSFVGMENAEFNVVYKAVPVNVVVDSDATKTELYAANELASYIERVTGKAVTVGVETRDTNNIYVSTNPSLGLAMDSFKLSTDVKGNIHINGTDERGTLYGVYEYEEANLGIKFLTEEYTHVPFTGKQISTLSNAQEKNYVPAFPYRTYMNNGVGLDGDNNVKYSSHLRFVSQFSQEKTPTELMGEVQYFMPWMAKPWLSASHSLITYAAIGAYLTVPEKNYVTATFDASGKFTSVKFTDSAIDSEVEGALDDTIPSMPDVCYSSATAREWVTAGLKYMIDTYGAEYDYFMLGQADKTTECNCSACKKAIVQSITNWNPKQNKADLTATFVRDVVNTVNGYGEKYSSEKIVMFAYQKTEPAPKNSIDMPDNVYVQWAPIDQDRYFALDSTNPNGWKTKTGVDKFMVWSYETDFAYYFNYYPTMHTWIDNFTTYKELGVEAVMMQSTWNTSGVADTYLDAYVASKLLWNFDASNPTAMEAVMKSAREEFIGYFYGPDAKSLIIQYYDEFDALYEEKVSEDGYKGGRSFNANEINELLSLINQAKEKTTDATYLDHLNILSFTPRYMLCQYCSATDNDLLNDMYNAGVTRSTEATLIENDNNLSGNLTFKKGGAEVKNIEYDGKGRVIHLTLEMPDNSAWDSSSPSFTKELMQDLYSQGVRTIQMYSKSTATNGKMIYTYNTTYNYDCKVVENIALTSDGTELRFSYVDVSGNVHGSGQTIGTTLDLYFNYLTANQSADAQSVGMTLGSGVQVFNNQIDGSLVVQNTNGDGSPIYFSKETVNSYIGQGYKAVSFTVEFATGSDVNQIVGYDTEAKVESAGSARWTFHFITDTPIKVWAQKSGGLTSGAFIIKDVELYEQTPAYDSNYATVISEQYNESGYLTQLTLKFPDNVAWNLTPPQLNSAYLDDLYKNGVTALTVSTTVESGDYLFATEYNGTAGYSASRRIALVNGGGALKFAYVKQGGFTAEREVTISFAYEAKTSAEIASEIGATLNGTTTISKNGERSYDVYDTNGMDMGVEFTATQVNSWIDQGYVSISFRLTFVAVENVINKTVVYTAATNYIEDTSGVKDVVITLVRDESIYIWSQYNDMPKRNSTFTISDVSVNYMDYYSQGYATITNEQINENNLLTGLTATFNNETSGWELNAPTLTEEYLNALYKSGVRAIVIGVIGNSKHFLTRYNGNVDWSLSPIQLVENGGALEFTHVDVSAGNGLPVAGTLNLTFRYGIDINAEIGATANGNTTVCLNGGGSYDVYDTYGADKALEFTASQVNAWLDQGYGSISFRLTFTAVAGVIDETVVYTASKGYIEDYSGLNDVTITLVRDQNILIWTQENHIQQLHSTFTLSNFKLNHYSFNSGYSTVIDQTIDENGRLTSLTISIPTGIDWWENTPAITGQYLADLYASGVRTLTINGTTTTPLVANQDLTVFKYDGGDILDYAESGNSFTKVFNIVNNPSIDIIFAYAAVSSGGATIATTLTLTFSYS